MSLTTTMLDIAEKVIHFRASMDGYQDGEYDAIQDSEGYVTSILTALRHWSSKHNIDFQAELDRSQQLFEEDVAEEADQPI